MVSCLIIKFLNHIIQKLNMAKQRNRPLKKLGSLRGATLT